VALRKHPIVNGSIEGEAIRYNKNINIGIAVALDWGLIVPVIKQTEEKNFLGIARAIVDVAERARGKKLAPDEISGGTFTLTNSGIFGEQFGTPIINQPQSAILGHRRPEQGGRGDDRQGRQRLDRDPLDPAVHAGLRSPHRRWRRRGQVHVRLQGLS
jgi:pyruvate/2-oxoglutarate dehydrogenase complex dihydrolipoamide acyltransferase (E2) component